PPHLCGSGDRETGPSWPRVLLDWRRRAGARVHPGQRLRGSARPESDLGDAAAPRSHAARARRGAEGLAVARTVARLTLLACAFGCAHRTLRPEERAVAGGGAVHHVHAGE